jgi:hypothetical protein
MTFATITFCVASQRVFVVVYFVMTLSGNFWIHPRIILLNIINVIIFGLELKRCSSSSCNFLDPLVTRVR